MTDTLQVLEERIDRNGTRHQVVRIRCPRCGGAGGHDVWKATGWTCYECSGSGLGTEKRKIYTPEHAAKLAAQREKRAKKKEAEIRAQAEEENKIRREKWGFTADVLYLVLGDTFEIKDELKEAGARFSREMSGWFFTEKPAAWETIEVEVKELLSYDFFGRLEKKVWHEIEAYIKALKKAAMPQSAHVGSAGDAIEIELKHLQSIWFEGYYGSQCINKLQDDAGNIFIWKTGRSVSGDVDENGRLKLRATIKEHTEYKEEKQTVLTRCRVVKK